MDNWHSEWVTEEYSNALDNELNTSADFFYHNSLYNLLDNATDSPNLSRDDSIESYEDPTDKNDANVIKPTFKSVLQAKKRLQAFSVVKQLRKSNSKEEKAEEADKPEKTTPKKAKKALYPDDKAKAVIKEIEELKRREGKKAIPQDELVKHEVIIPPTIKSISLKEVMRGRSRSLSSEPEEQFKRREIKCRNFRRKSISPEDYSRKKSPIKKLNYPKNWTEYKQQSLTVVKDEELKAKLFPKQKYTHHELVSRIINFDLPSPIIDSFKSITVEEKIENVPVSFMRITRSKPSVVYSINFKKNRENFISRKQLFHIIPRDRRDIIEKLINTPSKFQPSNKNLQSRQWYSKIWKKSSDAECKILENSVGLSFLQTYSDEEEDNETEEVLICSSTKQNSVKRVEKPRPAKQIVQKVEPIPKNKPHPDRVDKVESHTEKIEKERPKLEKSESKEKIEKVKPQEEKIQKVEKEEKIKLTKVEKTEPQHEKNISYNSTALEKTEGSDKQREELTLEKKAEEIKKHQQDELNETKRAIRELEEELERRKAIKIEEELKEKEKKKKKKKQEFSSSEEEEEVPKRKHKKRKYKSKKKKQVEEESSNSSEERKRKKKNKKKEKYKKEKSRRRKEKVKKEESMKEHKTKKKDEDAEEGNLKDDKKKKKKIDDDDDDANSLDDKISFDEATKKKKKKVKKKKQKDVEEVVEIEVIQDVEKVMIDNKKIQDKDKEEVTNEPAQGSGKKRRRKNRWDNFDIEIIEKEQFFEVGKTDRSSSILLKDFEEIKPEIQPKQNTDKADEKKIEKRRSRSKEKTRRTSTEKVRSTSKEKTRSVSKEKARSVSKEKTGSSSTEKAKTTNKEDVKSSSKERIRSASNEKQSKHGKGSYEHREEEESKKSKIIESKPEKGSRKSKENIEKPLGDIKKKKETENTNYKELDHVKNLEGVTGKKEKDKADLEKSRKHSEKSEKTDADSKISRDRRSSGSLDKMENKKDRDISRESHYSEKLDSHQKGRRQKEEHRAKLENVRVKDEPDWEILRTKRKRHRGSDAKEPDKSIVEDIHFPEDLSEFPLEKEVYTPTDLKRDKMRSRASKEESRSRELGTPDTDDYRENWEKDPFPIWESEDEAPSRPREKLNNSWESDEETFERGHRVVEKPRSFTDTFDLEIPLNIKPFKRREFLDPDVELQLLKKESQTLSEERRRLEIEKQRVKELELKVIREVEIKVSRESKVKVESKEDYHKPKRKRSIDEKESRNTERQKGGRWDKREAQPRKTPSKIETIDLCEVKKEKPEIDDSSVKVSSSTSVNDTSAALENEYEEFMKAVTSTATPRKRIDEKDHRKIEISSTESSISGLSDFESRSSEDFHAKKPKKDEDQVKQSKCEGVINNLEEIEIIPTCLDSPAKHTITILPKDIPLIPMPLTPTEIKPVPVPSPQIDLDKIPKPLINLSLSANITLDIASKLTAPPAGSPINKVQEITNSPIIIPPVAIQSPTVQKPEDKISSLRSETIVNFASPLTDVSLDSVLFEEKPNEKDSQRLNNKPFVFTSMVLPSKRPLLDNSNLNLGDSDDEKASATKSMKSLEEIRKESLISSIKTVEEQPVESAKPKELEIESQIKVEKVTSTEKNDRERSRSPPSKRQETRRSSRERIVRRDASPRRGAHGKRESSPRRRPRDPSPRRRAVSPRRHSPPRRRSPPPRRRSPAKRKYSPRRSVSPRYRRRGSLSPRRKVSPKRSNSPKMRASSPKRIKSRSPEKSKPTLSSYKPAEPLEQKRPPSPLTVTSPLEGLKRSVADSTISDDLLPQPSINLQDYIESPVSRFYDKIFKPLDSPKRIPLDIRINQVLGVQKQEPKPINTTFIQKEEPKPITTTYANYSYERTQYSQQFTQVPQQKNDLAPVQKPVVKAAVQQSKSNFVQVGNMVRIVPTEDIPTVPVMKVSPRNIPMPPLPSAPPPEKRAIVPKIEKSHIVQVGNMLQIVPADISPEPPVLAEPKVEPEEPTPETPAVVQEKQSAETALRLKIAERRVEREQRRQEREKRRKEKEKRRKEKEKERQIKLKQRTENMIKKALQLEVEGGLEEEEESFLNETPAQWPPLPIIVSTVTKEAGKSILIRGGQSKSDTARDKRKIVQFADGVRPGEGTSPSGGEELSSPPPASKKLPKEKRYKKTKLHKKNQKKKVKVKIIKKRADAEESDEEDNMPPPSPPPGSPPPHLFPPRIKTHTINNVHPYIPTVVPIQSNHNQQLYRPQLDIIMHHPHHPPHHHGPPPPPPPHHHGPPPPPPHHHHHGPPPPPHHHHGPPPPSGPPPFHHGPPPPPGPHHVPPLPHGPPGHHHGPPPPYRL